MDRMHREASQGEGCQEGWTEKFRLEQTEAELRGMSLAGKTQ